LAILIVNKVHGQVERSYQATGCTSILEEKCFILSLCCIYELIDVHELCVFRNELYVVVLNY